MRKIKLFLYDLLYQFRKYKSAVFIFLSRKILKNEGGLDLFIIGRVKHAFYKAFGPKVESSQLDSEYKKTLETLKEKQYAPVNLKLSPELVKKIQEKIDMYIEDSEKSYVRGSRYGNTEEKYYTRALKKALANIPEIKDILTEELSDIIKSYYGTNYGVTSVLVWRNYHVPDEVVNKNVFSNDWHNDNISPTELKIFINMTDVTEQHGPLHVIDKGESKRLFASGLFTGRKKQYDIGSIEANDNIIRHTGSAGSAVFAHASCCLHRADIPAEGNYRDMLEFQFHPSMTPLSDNWYNEPLKYE